RHRGRLCARLQLLQSPGRWSPAGALLLLQAGGDAPRRRRPSRPVAGVMRLVLFDIDGTILSSDGAAPRAFRRALEEVFGTSGPAEGYSFAGRTDPQIARDLLRMAGLGEAEIEAGLERAWTLYTTHLAREFERSPAVVYPGVHA